MANEWDAVKAYFANGVRRLVDHQVTGRVKPMLPMEARVRNFTYAAQMHADVRFTARTYKGENYEAYDEEFRVFEGISLGTLPVMLGSSLCLL
jgi:DNA-directed RNA polymerase beta subunit